LEHDINSYLELSLYKSFTNKKLIYLIMILMIAFFLILFINIENYENISFLKKHNNLIVLCNENCTRLKKQKLLYINNHRYNFSLVKDNQISLELSIPNLIEESKIKSVKMLFERKPAIITLFKIFKERS